MRSYWLWFAFIAVAWVFALLDLARNPAEFPWRLALSALFFALFFLSPVMRDHAAGQTILLAVAAAVAAAALWPASGGSASPFPLLVYALISGEAVYRLPAPHASGVGAVLLAGALAPGLFGNPAFSPLFIGMYGLLLAAAFAIFRKTWNQETETAARNEALLSEYRKMKRRLVVDEQTAREEERAQIGRDIHDSVGHKLTALLMQLEVFRMQTDAETASRVQELKELAQESLEETRSAVKSLKKREPDGLSAVLGLIRKLEAESFFRVNFTVRHGALSALLSNTQSAAVYRAVQEALTNAMRHGGVREAEILFEAPGGGIFRFEVSNKCKESKPIREGFGLRSMRERIKSAGGRLDILQENDRFIVRGVLSMVKKGEAEA